MISSTDPAIGLIERLRTIDLETVAISAAIDSQGKLSAVGGLSGKLLGAIHYLQTVGVLRTIVVATTQNDLDPHLFETSAQFQIRAAATFMEALSVLIEEALAYQEVKHAIGDVIILPGREPVAFTAPLYQQLSLLRAIEAKSLPGENPAATGMNRWDEWRNAEIQRWEEELLAVPAPSEVVAWETLVSRFITRHEGVSKHRSK
jgi:hypothetical protein